MGPFFLFADYLHRTKMAKGVTLKDVAADKFITAYAAQLKKAGQIEVPAWSGIMKTASYKDLSPYDPDWFYVRSALKALESAGLIEKSRDGGRKITKAGQRELD